MTELKSKLILIKELLEQYTVAPRVDFQLICHITPEMSFL